MAGCQRGLSLFKLIYNSYKSITRKRERKYVQLQSAAGHQEQYQEKGVQHDIEGT